jgi:hypothetical protein
MWWMRRKRIVCDLLCDHFVRKRMRRKRIGRVKVLLKALRMCRMRV